MKRRQSLWYPGSAARSQRAFLRNARGRQGVAFAVAVALLWAPMFGCSFESPGASVADDMDDPNSYTCNCRCTAPTSQTRTLRIAAASDDAEQTPATGAIDTEPADLDLGVDRVGLRFVNVAIPPDSTIVSARVQLTADQSFNDNGTTATTLAIIGEAADNAAPFTTTPFNLSSRNATMAAVGWNPPAWAVNQSGAAQRTPELKTIIQEIVNRAGWQSGNALALQLSGVGRREAETFDDNPQRAAVLQVEFIPATVQDVPACMPADLNPNLDDNPVPSDLDLQLDCEHRVQETLSGLAGACGYPSQCACSAVPNSRGFNAACNDPCAETPLAPGCTNFNPSSGMTTATNAPGDAPVCLALRDPSSTAPQPMARHIYGMDSLCAVEGEASLAVGDENKTTGAGGIVLLSGEPCPAGECAVGVAYDLDLDPITFEVKFFSDPKFVDLTSTGASVPDGVLLDSSGLGVVEADSTETSARGRRNSNTQAYVLTNSDPVDLEVDWAGHFCALSGVLATNVDAEDPNVDEDEVLAASIDIGGEILNQPPRADAGADQTLECASPDGVVAGLDGSASSDGDNNVVSFQWFRGGRVGPQVGTDVEVGVPQGLGGSTTYVLRVIDAFGQSSEDSTSVAVVDTTAPEIDCNTPPTITPPSTPLTFTATSTDTCDAEVIAEITGFECFRFNGSGKRIDKTHSCGASFSGDTITIPKSNGVGDHIAWTVRAEDASGNASEVRCEVEVVNKGKH